MPTDTRRNAARNEILNRIRAANGIQQGQVVPSGAWEAIERSYRRHGSLSRDGVLELFEHRLRDYDSGFVRVSATSVAETVASLLAARGIQRVVIPSGLNAQWLPSGIESLEDDGLTAEELDQVDGVMTGASVAIAETGTVVLQNVSGQGRRMITLVPDYHLCVVLAEDVVETVPQAMERLQRTADVATTFVSGPSATADIEMTRIKGVHGPRSLDVVLID